MEIELKNCPFCGIRAFLHEDAEGFFYVACNGCINQTTHFLNGKDIVIERWNTRTSDTALERLEELETANRYALATFRALDRYTFEDSGHGLLITEAVAKLEALQ